MFAAVAVVAAAEASRLLAAVADAGRGFDAVAVGEYERARRAHTGTQVRIAAYGLRAANVVGLTDQTDLFFTVCDALRMR